VLRHRSLNTPPKFAPPRVVLAKRVKDGTDDAGTYIDLPAAVGFIASFLLCIHFDSDGAKKAK